ncbi:MAG: hypothetical protein ACR2O4_01180, partial [Hyphomicrobiaceae bacterium]
FCIALALTRGRVSPADLADAPWNDPEIARLIGVTDMEIRAPRDPDKNYDPDDPDWVVLETADGEPRRAECGAPLGTPVNPLSAAQIFHKFDANASGSGPGPADTLANWDDAACIASSLDRFKWLNSDQARRKD